MVAFSFYMADDINEMASILWSESAGDPEGWLPKLNTYFSMRRGDESLEQTMKRVSSGYRTKSPQYTKAKQGRFNAYEESVWNKMLKAVSSFVPDPNWRYIHHENYDLPNYRGLTESEIDQKLRKAWGNNVDFNAKVKIGQEHYMPLKSHYRR